MIGRNVSGIADIDGLFAPFPTEVHVIPDDCVMDVANDFRCDDRFVFSELEHKDVRPLSVDRLQVFAYGFPTDGRSIIEDDGSLGTGQGITLDRIGCGDVQSVFAIPQRPEHVEMLRGERA